MLGLVSPRMHASPQTSNGTLDVTQDLFVMSVSRLSPSFEGIPVAAWVNVSRLIFHEIGCRTHGRFQPFANKLNFCPFVDFLPREGHFR